VEDTPIRQKFEVDKFEKTATRLTSIQKDITHLNDRKAFLSHRERIPTESDIKYADLHKQINKDFDKFLETLKDKDLQTPGAIQTIMNQHNNNLILTNRTDKFASTQRESPRRIFNNIRKDFREIHSPFQRASQPESNSSP
jgi:hypothetical protein